MIIDILYMEAFYIDVRRVPISVSIFSTFPFLYRKKVAILR